MADKLSNAPIPRTYAELRRRVEAVVVAGRRRIDDAWVRTYHETGRLIHEHLLLNNARADYGAKVFTRLAAETEISKRTLYECVRFYRCFPIVRVLAQLGWNQCRLLCQVTDPKKRGWLLEQAKKHQWATGELETRIRERNAALELASTEPDQKLAKSVVKILKPRHGVPNRYRIVAREQDLAVDVGFKLYVPLGAGGIRPPRGVKAGDIVSLSNGDFTLASDATAADLFAYRATVRRVVDGDTLAVTIALPHCQMDEKLRLRGLDCPEMATPEGRAAKRFTERLLVDATAVVISTSKVDKYDRYLADVFIPPAAGSVSPPSSLTAQLSVDGRIFLNNALLENGHAVPMGNEAMTDWTP